MKRFFSYVFLIIILSVFSCKDRDKVAPTVSISEPSSDNKLFRYGEGITVKGIAEDDRNIEQIRIVVKNSNTEQTVLQPIIVTLNNQNPIEFEEVIQLSDIKMKGGNYYISVEVSDGENFSFAFRKFIYAEANKKREGLWLINSSDDEREFILFDENIENPNLILAENRGISHVAYSAYDQSIAVAGNKNHPFEIYTLSDLSTRNEIPSLNEPFFEYFTSLDYHDQYYYLGRYDSRLNGFSTFGSTNFASNLIGGFFTTKSFYFENQVVAFLRTINTQQRKIATFFMTGEVKNEKNIDIEVVEIVREANNRVLFLGNDDSGKSKTYTYNTESNLMFNSVNISQVGSLIKVKSITPDFIILAGTNGLFRLNALSQRIDPLYSINNIIDLDFDVVNQQVFVANTQSISIFNLSDFSLIRSIPISKTPKRIFVHYNK